MNSLQSIYSATIILSIIVAIAVAFAVWKNRSVPGAKALVGLLISLVSWALLHGALEISPAAITPIISRLRFFVTAITPVLFLIFALQYFGYSLNIGRNAFAWLFVLPLVTQIMVWTNSWHGLWVQIVSATPASGSNRMPDMVLGPWFWVHTFYSYLIVLIGIVLIIATLFRSASLYRAQARILLWGIVIPVTVYSFTFFVLDYKDAINIPIVLLYMGLIFSWGFFRHRLFRLAPVARYALIENTPDAMLVLDPFDRVADLNEAANQLLQVDADPVGKPAREFLPSWLAYKNLTDQPQDLTIERSDGSISHFRLRLTNLLGKNKQSIGRLLTISDISEYRLIERALKKHADELKALNSATASLLSTLEFDELPSKVMQYALLAFPDATTAILHLADEQTGELLQANTSGEIQLATAFENEIISWAKSIPQQDLSGERDFPIKAIENASQHTLIAALASQEKLLGTLTIIFGQPARELDVDIDLLRSYALAISAAINNTQLHAKVQRSALIDPLTSLYNRRGIVDKFEKEFQRSMRYGRQLSVIMIDVDNFKNLNDDFGHAAGDIALQHMANLIQQNIRSSDVAGRFGGDELVILLPETDGTTAQHLAARLVEQIKLQPCILHNRIIPISLSIGISCSPHEDMGTTLDDLLQSADNALYRAKHLGKNRIEVNVACSRGMP